MRIQIQKPKRRSAQLCNTKEAECAALRGQSRGAAVQNYNFEFFELFSWSNPNLILPRLQFTINTTLKITFQGIRKRIEGGKIQEIEKEAKAI